MRESMVPDLMTGLANELSNARMTNYIHTALKKCHGNPVVVQVVEERQAPFARAIVEGKGDGTASSGAPIH
jgi:hypothetical protein